MTWYLQAESQDVALGAIGASLPEKTKNQKMTWPRKIKLCRFGQLKPPLDAYIVGQGGARTYMKIICTSSNLLVEELQSIDPYIAAKSRFCRVQYADLVE